VGGQRADELLGLPLAALDKDCLYRSWDQLLEHRDALFKPCDGHPEALGAKVVIVDGNRLLAPDPSGILEGPD